ncbi:MAG: sugar phosphate isomerase/epimerase [Lachnospiraceae bacterium]|nr:sugar phosphate isomerase/epimerase [Lachnospiraceae bacterium]
MKLDLFVIPYSFKSLDLSQEEMLRLVKQIGFDGVEGGTLTDEYIELLDKYGLKCCNCNMPLEPDGSVSEETLKRLEQYNANDIVKVQRPDEDMAAFFAEMMDPVRGYRGIPGAFGTFEDAIAAAEKEAESSRIAARYNYKTIYHNHTHEWRTSHGEYIMDTYLRHAQPNHVMELDVGWALTAGTDPIYWMKRWPGRIGCLHIKSCNWAMDPEALGMSCPVPKPEIGLSRDRQNIQQAYAEGPQGPMEKSICDWGEVIRAALDAGCNTFIVERERIYSGDAIECLQADHDHIRKCMDAL